MTRETTPASATAESLALLRRALAEKGIRTEDADVMVTTSGHPTLSLAPGLLVWSIPRLFRWFTAGGMVLHSSADPTGAADLLAALFDQDPRLRQQREYLQTLLEPSGGLPI
ncbi:hypothetical protein [Streptosporangium sandarakinum]|uniref:hypothetical protein n=1 Tax=Streptosporangium sandarakinum TaxID=1260955 RepID=UPI003796D6E2